MQVQQAVRHQYPDMEVLGSHYPVPAVKAVLAKAVTVVQFGTIGLALVGTRAFEAFGWPPQPWLFGPLEQHKVPVCLGAWFVGNVVGNSLTSTGAFEIYFDGKLIWSKLETNRMPGGADLFMAINAGLAERRKNTPAELSDAERLAAESHMDEVDVLLQDI